MRTRTNASPSLAQDVERFTQYLTLVGLTALLVGGVGVANAVKNHLDRKRTVIATLKSVGATGTEVFAIYLVQVIGLACLGALPGLAVGAALPYLIVWGFGAVLPLPVAPALHAGALGARAPLRRAHRGRVRAVAARTRPGRAGLDLVPRRGRGRHQLAAPLLHRGDRRGGGSAGGARGGARP